MQGAVLCIVELYTALKDIPIADKFDLNYLTDCVRKQGRVFVPVQQMRKLYCKCLVLVLKHTNTVFDLHYYATALKSNHTLNIH
jgi:hypothetical protein